MKISKAQREQAIRALMTGFKGFDVPSAEVRHGGPDGSK